MAQKVLRKYVEGGFEFIEFTDDGLNVSNKIKQPIPFSEDIADNLTPTSEEIAEETLLETKYQTFLLEIMV